MGEVFWLGNHGDPNDYEDDWEYSENRECHACGGEGIEDDNEDPCYYGFGPIICRTCHGSGIEP